MANDADRIDIEQIAEDTGVDEHDVILVLRQLMGWDGDQGHWFSCSHVRHDQQTMLFDHVRQEAD